MIRQWLKDQYILYRNYSNLAQTVNSKYIPVSLEDAKRVCFIYIVLFNLRKNFIISINCKFLQKILFIKKTEILK